MIAAPSPADTAPVVAPRQRRKQARPQELLEAALDLFVEKGFAATRAEEVARRAGVSKGTLYVYFADKGELLGAWFTEIAGELAEVLSAWWELDAGSSRD